MDELSVSEHLRRLKRRPLVWNKCFLLAAVLITTASAAEGQDGAAIPFEKDVIYSHAGGEVLKVDVARPASGIGPFPVILCIHGGGWQLGNKSIYGEIIRAFARRGYVAASLDYRLTPRFRWPAQIQDVKCAIRYLRAHASEYRIDPNRFAVLGDSAGGHLALMAGLTDARDGLEGPSCGDPNISSRVQAVVDFFGPTDLTSMRVPPEGERLVIQAYGGDSNHVLFDLTGSMDRSGPIFRKISPVNYVDPADCPVLIFHGTADPLVPLEQSQLLDRALEKAGVPHRLEIVDGGGHGWTGTKLEQSLRLAMEFLDKTLKR